MQKIFLHLKKYIFLYLFLYSFILSWALAFHNIPLYHYKHGFDGAGHIDYMTYIVQYNKLPPASHGWETHQSPLYYLIGSVLIYLFDIWKAAQYINIFILWITIFVAMATFKHIFPKKNDGMYLVGTALSALPMLNIFQVMVTNELMNTMFSLIVILFLIALLKIKEFQKYSIYSFFVTLFFILGFYTKVSIIMIAPLIFGAYMYIFLKSKFSKVRQIAVGSLMLLVVFASCYPLYLRATTSVGPSNLGAIAASPNAPHTFEFYTRLDWIYKIDMYNTQYYSMLGGAYNSFFNDGHNAVTPFVPFHKKAFILWSMGFILMPLSLYGQYLIYKKKKIEGIFIFLTGILMFAVFVFYNTKSGHYSAVRLTYETPIVLPYALGLGALIFNKYLKYLIAILLFIQMTILVSFYWIEPWWHVTKGF